MGKGTENNEFLKYIYDLYDVVYNIKEGNTPPVIIERKMKDPDNLLDYLFGKEEEKRYPDLDDKLEKIDRAYRTFSSFVPSFSTLWDFCEFIRVSEKIFFHRNDPDDFVYVEMRMDKPENIRKICINGNAVCGKLAVYDPVPEDCEVRLTLEKNPYGLNIITVTVLRDFGLKMQNTYKIANGDMEYADASDMYLINQINDTLKRVISIYFLRIVEQILNEGGLYEYSRDISKSE